MEGPSSWLAWGYMLEKINCGMVLCLSLNLFNLRGMQVLNAYICFEMILNKEGFSLLIDPFEGMSTEAIHVSEPIRYTSLWEEEHDVHDTFRRKTNEVPTHVWVSHISCRVSFPAVDNIRELDGVSNEEERRIVADKILNAFLSVELYRKASGVSVNVWKALFSQCCRKTNTCWSTFPYLVQEFSFCILCCISSHFQISERTCSYMHDSFWDSFSVELS